MKREPHEMIECDNNLYFGKVNCDWVRIVKFSAPPNAMTWHSEEATTVATLKPRSDGHFHDVKVLADITIKKELLDYILRELFAEEKPQ